MRLINFQQHCKTIQWGKNNLFNKMMLGRLGIHSTKGWNCISYLTPSSKFNSKWIKDLSVRAEAEELLEPSEPPGKTLRKKYRCKSSWPWNRQLFLRYNTKPQAIKGKIDKLDFIKDFKMCALKYTIRKVKRQAIVWEKILLNHKLDKGLVFRMQKNY